MIHDAYCRSVIEANPNKLVAWWIMAAWAYEKAAEPIISDALFDEIATRLNNEWDTIEHCHKTRLSRADLKSSLAIAGQWPPIAIGAAKSLIAAATSPPPPPPQKPVQQTLFDL